MVGRARGGGRSGAVAALALALTTVAPAFAMREHWPAPPDAVRWLAPAPDALLAAGGQLTVAWEPGPAFAALGAVEEWELFLSYDGGRTWAVRLTPHLDLGRRRLAVTLPALASDDVRLLMRVGDERVEHEVEHGGRFRIAPARAPVAVDSSLRFLRRAPGESARERGVGTVLWWEGDRDGARTTFAAYRPISSSYEPAQLLDAWLPVSFGAPERAPSVSEPAAHELERRSTGNETPPLRSFATRLPAIPPLLQACRSNR